MSFLFDLLPGTVKVLGSFYQVNTDFKVILKIIELLKDPFFSDEEKASIAIELFYKDKIKPEPDFLTAMLKFINKSNNNFFGIADEDEKIDIKDNNAVSVLSYTQDAEEIYSAFFRVYHIDLLEANLHWYKFVILLSDICEKTNLATKMEIRNIKISDIDPKKRAEFLQVQNKIRVKI